MSRSLPSLPVLLILALVATSAAAQKPSEAKPAAPSDAKPSDAKKTEEKKPEAPVDPQKQRLIDLAAGSGKAPDVAPLEPPDGKWLKDELGREYFVVPVPRLEGGYRWLNDEHTQVRLPYGLSLDVASYDETNFYIKIYKPT